jgi:hypothetical protein
MPGSVWVGSWSVFAGVLFVAVSGVGMRWRLALGLVALAALAVPTYILYISGVQVGVGVQPRYLLPLLTLFAVTAMVRLDGAAFRLTAGQRWIVVALLTFANSMAMHTSMKRYLVGFDGISFNLNHDVEWWWQIPISPMALWFLGTLAFGAGVTLLTREFTTVAPGLDTPASTPGVLVDPETPGPDRVSRPEPCPAEVTAAPAPGI